VARLRREGLALLVTDRVKGAAMVTASSRIARERYVEQRQQHARQATTTIIRPPRVAVGPASAPIAASVAATCVTRPRERHARAGTSRTSSATGDDPSPPPPPPRAQTVCARPGCGISFTPAAAAGKPQLFHSPACGNADRQRRFKARSRTGDALLDLYLDEVHASLRRDELAEHDALALAATPSSRVLAAIAVRELVAHTLAPLDSGRMDVARRAAGPIACEIFVELEASR
jgi:hypothetical protein